MREAPKYEIMQQLKMILVRNAVDLTRLHYTVSGRDVSLYGELLRDPSGEFKVEQIETLSREIERLPYGLRLRYDLSNWNVSYEYGTWNIVRSDLRKRQEISANNPLTDTYVIDSDALWDEFGDD